MTIFNSYVSLPEGRLCFFNKAASALLIQTPEIIHSCHGSGNPVAVKDSNTEIIFLHWAHVRPKN